MLTRATRTVISCLVLTILITANSSIFGRAEETPAGPSSGDPQTSVMARGASTEAIVKKLDTLYREHLASYVQLLDHDPTPADGELISTAYRTAIRVRVIAKQLTELREVAGYDYLARADAHLAHLRRIAETIKGSPEFMRAQAKVAKEYMADARSREKKLAKIRTLIRQEQWDEADNAFNQLVGPLEHGALWLAATVHEPVMKSFDKERREIAAGLLRIRQQQVVNEVSTDPDFAPIDLRESSREIAAAVEQLRNSPDVDFRGRRLTGPQLVDALHANISEMCIRVIRHSTLQGYEKGSRNVALEKGVESLRTEFTRTVRQLVENDVERLGANEESLKTSYLSYVKVLGSIAAETLDRNVTEEFQSILDPFLMSKALRAEVETYELATEGILNWRQRIADTQAMKSRKDAEEMDLVIQKNSRELRADDGGLQWTSKPGIVADPLDVIAKALAPRIIDQRIAIQGIIATKGDQPYVLSPLRTLSLARFPRDSIPALSSVQLKKDLLVENDQSPLTVRAAAALWGVENGLFEEVGGEVTELELNALGPMMVNATSESRHLIGARPHALLGVSALEKQVVVMVTLRPTWWRGRYFFISGR